MAARAYVKRRLFDNGPYNEAAVRAFLLETFGILVKEGEDPDAVYIKTVAPDQQIHETKETPKLVTDLPVVDAPPLSQEAADLLQERFWSRFLEQHRSEARFFHPHPEFRRGVDFELERIQKKCLQQHHLALSSDPLA